MKAGQTPNYDKPAEVADAPRGAHVGPLADRPGPEAAPAAPAVPPPSQEGEKRYRLSSVWEDKGLLDPRGWVQPTHFVLRDECGCVAYRMIALSAWSDRRISIEDGDGRPLAALHKPWSYASFRLLRGGRVAAKIAYKDPLWSWQHRYVTKTADGTKLVAVHRGGSPGGYEFRQDGRTLGRYSRREGLQLSDAIDPLLFVATVLVIELPREGSPGA
ncbi:MAG: hypothetical protein M3N47_04310 [Chloroflexota bacterium]|nr:hypothetical protein [Chloroflexota bacterium]